MKMANLNYNKAIVGGRLTAKPELKTTQSGTSYTNFIVASNRRPDKQGKVEADFITCKAFGNTAEVISRYFGKGSNIMLDGRIQTGSYDKNGIKVYTTDVMVDNVYFVDSKADNTHGFEQSVNTANVQPTGYVPEAYTNTNAPRFEEIDADDDLPF